MTTNRVAIVGLVVLAAVGSPGCVTFLGPEDLRLAVSLSSGVALEREFCVGADGLTVKTISSIAGMPIPVNGLWWVDVGIYKIHAFDLGSSGSARFLLKNIELPGWEPIVRIRDGDGDETAVLIKHNDSSVRGMVVFARDDDELVIARLAGRIDKLLEGFLDSGGLAKYGWPGLAHATGAVSE